MKFKQIGMLDYCIVDSFAGGGGASTGIEMATGHPVDIAINHNEAAIMMHRRNHPYTEHYIEDIWKVDPKSAVRGRHVRLAWFSPDCKHFSRAKGSALVDKKIRGLAWVVLKWAHDVKPDVIMLENVPEFVTWGPVRKGKPIKSRAGETYNKWLQKLKDLGYEIETRKLCAADYGAPTIRTRFHLIARRDGRAIVFPERTHAPRDSEEVKNGKYLPWRAAAEVIDFDLPCPSIFDTKAEIKEKYGLTAQRPLKSNTLQRIARGLDKFVIKSAEPFIVPRGYGEKQGQTPRVHDINEPLPTQVGTPKHYVCDPIMTPYTVEVNHGGGERIRDLNEPLNTITAKHSLGVAEPALSPFICQHKFNNGAQDVEEPLSTVTAVDHNLLTVAHLAHFKGKDKGQHLLDPLMTITSKDALAEVRTMLVKYDGKQNLYRWSEVRSLLNTYCGYDIKDDEVLLINILGIWWFISDIGLRMLIPREQYDGMGFPHDYIIDRDVNGNVITRADQVARCGNAVCPAVAEALVRANLPECCTRKVDSMHDLHDVMMA